MEPSHLREALEWGRASSPWRMARELPRAWPAARLAPSNKNLHASSLPCFLPLVPPSPKYLEAGNKAGGGRWMGGGRGAESHVVP